MRGQPIISSPISRVLRDVMGATAGQAQPPIPFPLSLFAGGELGAVGDLTDLSRLRQTIDGAAVAAVGDPIGHVLDLRLPETFSAFQSTSDHRPVLGRVPPRGRVNLLRWSDVPTNAYWTVANGTVTQSSGIYRLTAHNQTSQPTPRVVRSNFLANSTQHTYTIEVRRGNYDFVMLSATSSTSNFPSLNSAINLSTKSWITGGGSIGTRTITDLEDGWMRLRVTLTTGAGGGSHGYSLRLVPSDGTSGNSTFAGTEYVEFRRMQVELGGSPTDYQLITDPHDVSETGQPDIYHAFHDGVDDKLTIPTPAMGSQCTVASRSETGVTYLENQTIGAGVYQLPIPQRLIRYLVIDRTLTSDEKTQLTAWLAGGMAA